MSAPELEFNRGAVRPMECLREGWGLIKDEYWLFLGITLVGLLIGGAAPLGILNGPMVCGIHICFLRKMNGQQVGFDRLFKGFNYFMPSFLVTLAMLVPMLLLMGLFYAGFCGSIFTLLPAMQQQQQQGGPPDATALLIFLGLQALLVSAFIVALTLLTMFLLFAFPLVVDRELSAGAAILTSCKAVLANFGGVLGLMVLWNVLGVLISLVTCYIGLIFLLPLFYAAATVAYRQVFPALLGFDQEAFDDRSDDAPPVVALAHTGILSQPDDQVTASPPPGPLAGSGPSVTGIQGEPTRGAPPPDALPPDAPPHDAPPHDAPPQ